MLCSRCCSGVGARISLSRLKSNHQKISDLLAVVACIIACMIFPSILLNRLRLFLSRSIRHVDRKWGGSML